MSFDIFAICEQCGAVAPARDEGELPLRWFEVGEKDPTGALSMVTLDTPECLLAYARQRSQQPQPVGTS